jgi:metallo-beta-lactamase family protein
LASLTFLGGTGTVTGSKFLVEHNGFKLLVDCGLFQGLKELRLRNWSPPPVEPRDLDAVVVSHAHLDHTGYIPLLVRRGYEGAVHATAATVALCGILLPDSGHLQEEDARFANKHGFSKHRPALPLYTEDEARASLASLRPAPFDRTLELREDVSVRFYPAGHIVGASLVEVRLKRNGAGPGFGRGYAHANGHGGRETVLLFSGDLGRPSQKIVPPPSPPPPCDHLILESTYGNRDHPSEDPKDRLERIIRETVAKGGTLLIPAFAVGRTQVLLYLLKELQDENRLPTDIPIHVDSPMAIHATRIVLEHPEAHGFEMRDRHENGHDPLGLRNVFLDTAVEDSKALNALRYPAIIISASGMAEGGRILHHLEYKLPDHRTTVLFVGFQAAGTRGRALQDGARSLKMYGKEVPVRARIETLDGLSAHADRGEILQWLGTSPHKPGRVHLVHGEPEALATLAGLIREERGFDVHIPEYLAKVKL